MGAVNESGGRRKKCEMCTSKKATYSLKALSCEFDNACEWLSTRTTGHTNCLITSEESVKWQSIFRYLFANLVIFIGLFIADNTR